MGRRRDKYLSDELTSSVLGTYAWTKDWDLGGREMDDAERDGRLIALAREFGNTREEIVQIVGQAASREGKSFDESLLAYCNLYTDGTIPVVEIYRGRVPCRGVSPAPDPEPVPVRETLFQEIQPVQTGRRPSRGL